MGPPPPESSWEEVDHHSIRRGAARRASLDSCFTTATTTGSESQKGGFGGPVASGTLDNSGRRSQGYLSLSSAANSTTYLIDATGADPILLPAHELYSGTSCYPPDIDSVTPVCGNGGSSSNGYRHQQMIPHLDNGFGGGGDLFVPPPPPPLSVGERNGTSGYTSGLQDERRNIEKRGAGKANGRAAGGRPPAGGQCNHLSDGCECFRDFPQLPPRKVRLHVV